LASWGTESRVEARRDVGGLVARTEDARRFDKASDGQVDAGTQKSAALGFCHGRWRRRSRLRRLQIVELSLEISEFRLVVLLDTSDFALQSV
jgi:hypothetical protein